MKKKEIVTSVPLMGPNGEMLKTSEPIVDNSKSFLPTKEDYEYEKEFFNKLEPIGDNILVRITPKYLDSPFLISEHDREFKNEGTIVLTPDDSEFKVGDVVGWNSHVLGSRISFEDKILNKISYGNYLNIKPFNITYKYKNESKQFKK